MYQRQLQNIKRHPYGAFHQLPAMALPAHAA